jgi:hypothetical protein
MKLRINYVDASTKRRESVEIDADPATFSVQILPPIEPVASDVDYWYDDFLDKDFLDRGKEEGPANVVRT